MNQTTANDDFARMIDGSTLVIQRWMPGSAARLWTYLVDAELRRKWFADGTIPLAAGGAFELIWRNDDLSQPGDPKPDGAGGEQRMKSEVVEVDAPRRLVIRWGNGTVTFDLQEKADRVRLTITHTGLGSAQTGIMAGWHSHLDILGALVAGSPVPSFWSGWSRVQQHYKQQIADPAKSAD